MKQTTCILMALMFISSCQKEKSATTHSDETDIYIVADTTDPHLLYPPTDPILALYGFEEDENKEALFWFACITDKRLNPSIEFHLENGDKTEKNNCQDDPQYREKVVMAFYDSIRATLDGFSKACEHLGTLQYSECYRAIATGLSTLSKSKASKRFLFIYSDVLENSDIFNCYDTARQRLIQNNPKKVAEIFNKAYPLPQDLSGIHVVFVFIPKDRAEDQKYLAMIEIYKILIESKGGVITVQANNKNFKL